MKNFTLLICGIRRNFMKREEVAIISNKTKNIKRLMLLGGSRYLLPIIDMAQKLKVEVITCDYLPNNIAHRYSDKYCNISVTDKDAVLKAAVEMEIDGIMSFACDPGVVTAAYVAEKMRLPFQCSYDAAVILQDKGKFRKFLIDNGFNSPHAKRYEDIKKPYDDIDYFNRPVIVKPVDSAGSKGVTRVESPKGLHEAIKTALDNAHNGAFVVEDFLIFEGYHSSEDSFTVNGDLRFITYSDQLFDLAADNPYTPAYIIWPSTMQEKYQKELSGETQRLMRILGMKTGIYNIETCVATDGTPYIMEISPRGGGCKIAEIQQSAFGVKLIENEVRKAVRLPLKEMGKSHCDGHWCDLVIHAKMGQRGIFKNVTIDPDIREKYVKVIDLAVDKGDYVSPFTGANKALGDMFLRFDSREELEKIVLSSKEWLHIDLS